MSRPVTYTLTGVSSTPWVSVNNQISPSNLSVACHIASGSATYVVEYTYQDVNYNPNSLFAYVVDSPTIDVFPDTLVNGATVDAVAVQPNPVKFARMRITTGTGSVRATFLQAGIAGN